MKKACRSNLPALVFLFALLMLWQLGATKVNAAYILPAPIQILKKLWELRIVLFTVHLPATMLVTLGIAYLAGAWPGPCCADGCQSVFSESCVSDCCGIPDDPDHCHCAVVCALVRLRYLEQGAGDGTHHIFPHHHHGV